MYERLTELESDSSKLKAVFEASAVEAASSSAPASTAAATASAASSVAGGEAPTAVAAAPDVRRPQLCPIRLKRELCPGGVAAGGGDELHSCLHIEFDLSQTPIKYTTGDYLGVFPHNERHLVEVKTNPPLLLPSPASVVC